MRHPVRSIMKRRCDPFKEGSRDEGEVKEGHSRSFAHKSNNGVIFHAGFVPVVSPSQLFASEAEVFTQAIHEGGRRTNTLISLPVHSPSHLHSSHISASILIHTLPSLLPPSRPLSSANRIYTHIYSFVRVVTTHPYIHTHIHTQGGGRATTSISESTHTTIATHTYTQRQAHTCTCANARPPAYK